MKHRFTLLFILLMQIFAFSQITVSYSVSPSTFDETEAITVTFTVNENSFGVAASHSLYLWAWSVDTANVSADCPTNGTWASSGATNKLTYTGGTSTAATYTYTMNTVSYTHLDVYKRQEILKILFRI